MAVALLPLVQLWLLLSMVLSPYWTGLCPADTVTWNSASPSLLQLLPCSCLSSPSSSHTCLVKVLASLSLEIIKATADRCAVINTNYRSFDGVVFLLPSDFLSDPVVIYAVADSIACSEDGLVILELRSFMQEHWSEEAYAKGVRIGQEHFVDLVRIFERGEMPVLLRDLPRALLVAIGYLPLYRECVEAVGLCCLTASGGSWRISSLTGLFTGDVRARNCLHFWSTTFLRS